LLLLGRGGRAAAHQAGEAVAADDFQVRRVENDGIICAFARTSAARVEVAKPWHSGFLKSGRGMFIAAE